MIPPTIAPIPQINQMDLVNFMNGLSQTNATYLGISVTTLLAVGAIAAGLFWLFSIKPLEKDLKQQKENLNKIEKSLKSEIRSSILKNEDKVNELIAKISDQNDFKYNELKNSLDLLGFRSQAEVARLLALSSRKEGFKTVSFYWWLTAANYFLLAGADDLCKVAVNNTKKEIEKIKKEKDSDATKNIDKNWLENEGKMSLVREYLTNLKGFSEIQIKDIENTLDELLK